MRGSLLFCGMMILVLGFTVSANATVMGTGDLLGGIGDLDTPAQQGSWTLETGDNAQNPTTRGLAEFADGGANLYATYTAVADPQGKDWAQAGSTSFASVANRAHRLSYMAKQANGATSANSKVYMYFNLTVYTSIFENTLGTTASQVNFDFTAGNLSAIPGSGVISYSVQIRDRETTTPPVPPVDAGIWIDEIRVYRELATPQVASQSLSTLDTTGDVTLGNAGGTLSDMLIAYDPDVTVTWLSGAAATVNSFTWNSDNELVANITPGGVGEAVFSVSNPYGGESDTFTLNITPEPATLSLVLLGTVGMVFRRRK